MPKASRVGESSTSTSSATITLGGAIAGRRTVASKHTVGETGIELVIEDATNWLEGVYTFTSAAPTVMTRTAILSSSNSDGDVTFPAGAKTVQETASATFINALSGVRSIPFSSALPFTFQGETYMPQQSVSGPLAFTIAGGAVKGAYVIGQLVGDGTNTPTWDANIKDSGGGVSYDVRSGYPTKFYVWYDGFDYLRQYGQIANATPVPTLATAMTLSGPSSGVVSQASTAFSVGANGTITGTVTWTATESGTGAAGSFTPATGSTPGSFTYTPGSTGAKTISIANNGGLTNPSPITYTVVAAATAPAQMAAPTATGGDTTASVTGVAPATGGSPITGYTVTSSPAGMTDSNAGSTSLTHAMTGGTNATAYTFTMRATNAIGTSPASPASNSVTLAPVVTAVRLSPRSADMTESGSAPWVYSSTGPTYGGAIGGIATKALQSGVDGSLEIRFTGAPGASEIMLMLRTSNTVQGFGSALYAVYTQSSNGNYQAFTSGSAVGASTVPVVSGDRMRLRRTGSNVVAEKSPDGTNYTTIFTWTAANTGVLYFQAAIGTAAGTITNLVDVGLS